MKNICQFYHYNSGEYNLEINNPEYFSENFNYDQICDRSVNWLNFHNIDEIEHIKKLCDNFNIDKITTEDIFRDLKPKLEEYTYYIFFTIFLCCFLSIDCTLSMPLLEFSWLPGISKGSS
jgi:Mg2+ and Co2+ transporter CorA